MKLSLFAQALLSLAVVASPIASSAVETDPNTQGVRIGNPSDALVSRPSSIKDNDTIMVIPDLDEKMAVLRVVGAPGPGQPGVYRVFRCEPNPRGGLFLRSCARQGQAPLNQTIDLIPGYYVIEYAGSTHHMMLKEGDKKRVKLKSLYYPERGTSAGLRISIIRDLTNPSEFDKAVRELGGLVFRDQPVVDLVNRIADFPACDKQSFLEGDFKNYYVNLFNDIDLNGRNARAIFEQICSDRDRTTALTAVYRDTNLFVQKKLGPAFQFGRLHYRSGWWEINFWRDGGAVSTEVKSTPIQSGEFISVLPGVYAIGTTRPGEGSEISYKGGLFVSEKVEDEEPDSK